MENEWHNFHCSCVVGPPPRQWVIIAFAFDIRVPIRAATEFFPWTQKNAALCVLLPNDDLSQQKDNNRRRTSRSYDFSLLLPFMNHFTFSSLQLRMPAMNEKARNILIVEQYYSVIPPALTDFFSTLSESLYKERLVN